MSAIKQIWTLVNFEFRKHSMDRPAKALLTIVALSVLGASPDKNRVQQVRPDAVKPETEIAAADDPNAVEAIGAHEPMIICLRNPRGNIDTIQFRGGPEHQAAMLPHLNGLHSLRRLQFLLLDDDDLVHVKGLTTLEALDLGGFRGTGITDAGLANLRGLVRLKRLSLRMDKGITDKGLANLAALTDLQHLDLAYTAIQGEGLKHLANLKKLDILDLRGTRLDDAGLANLPPLPLRFDLGIQNTQLTDKSLPLLVRMGRRVNVSGTKITRHGVEAIPGGSGIAFAKRYADDIAPGEENPMPKATPGAAPKADGVIPDDPHDSQAMRKIKYVHYQLDANGNISALYWPRLPGDDGKALSHVKGLHSLRMLDLSGDFTDDDLAAIEGLKTLEVLQLCGTKATDAGLVHLRGLAALTVLHLTGRKGGTDAETAEPAGSGDLQKPHLERTNVRGEGFKHLQGLKKLKGLNLTDTQIDDGGLAFIGLLESLEGLELSGTRVTDAGLPNLKKLSNLNALGVADTQVTRAGGERLIADLPKLGIQYPEDRKTQERAIPDDPKDAEALRKIKYVFCRPKKKGNIEVLVWTDAAPDRRDFSHLKGLHSVKRLWLSGNFSDDDLAPIEGLKTLDDLDLSRTSVTDAGLAHLRGLTALRILHLTECKGVTDAGLVHLAGLMALERLYLDRTRIHGDGLKHLQGLKELRLLDVAYTQIDNDSLATVAMLRALDNLDVSGTGITDSGLHRLRRLSNLKMLETWETQVTRAGGERLIAELPKLAIGYPMSQGPEKAAVPGPKKEK
jgi:Leucine-rich repeat (LRR) protein